MIRAVLTGGALAIAVSVLWLAFVFGGNTPVGTLLVNLGTELVGIVLTLAVVEWFFEKRRLRSRGRQLAWDVFHAVQHAVWVWQGGPREMDTDEVRAVLQTVQGDDPIPDFTEGLLVSLGMRSGRVLTNDPDAVQTIPNLMNGLEELTRFSSLRDGKHSLTAPSIASTLDDATRSLAAALDQPTEAMLPGLIRYRDSSVAMQEKRHFGQASAM